MSDHPTEGVAVPENAPTPISMPQTPPTASDDPREAMLREMLKCGVHFGHQTARWNPKMKPFIFTERGGVHIIDLVQTIDLLEEAKKVIMEVIARGGIILFVCTKRQGQQKIAEIAEKCHMPYINSRWLGGFFTNFETLAERIRHYNELKAKQLSGELESMIKKEKVVLNKKIQKMETLFKGVANLKKVPDLVFIIDPKREKNAVKEALVKNIPIMSTLDTNCDPDVVDYPIPANDDAIRSIYFVLDQLGATAEAARREYELKHPQPVAPVRPTAAPSVSTSVPGMSSTRVGATDEEDTVVVEPEVTPPAGEEKPAVSTAITAEKLPGIKTSVLTTLQAAFPSWEQLQQAGENDLTALDGIGPATAKKIVALIQ